MNELHTFFNPKKQRNLSKDLITRQVEKRDKIKWEELDPNQKKGIRSFLIIAAPAIILRFVGLMSYNWLIFAMWIIWGFIIAPFSKEIMFRFQNRFILNTFVSFTALINVGFSAFVILNSYHFLIDNKEIFYNIVHFFKAVL